MRKVVSWFIVLLLSVGSVPNRCFGDGKVIFISNNEEFMAFADEVSRGNTFYKDTVVLMNDIVIEGSFYPIGDFFYPFSGVFEGNGKSITFCINIPYKQKVGLFRSAVDATFTRLTINGSICGEDEVGAFVGYARDTKFVNCRNNAWISGKGAAGGFAGAVSGEVLFDECVNFGGISYMRGGGIFYGKTDNPSGIKFFECKNFGYIKMCNGRLPIDYSDSSEGSGDDCSEDSGYD